MAKKVSLRKEVLSDLKDKLDIHNKGKYLAEPNKGELEKREAKKEIRKKELEEVEKAIRDKQVKFLATEKELDEIKNSARLDHKTLSNFIRSAIWEKIVSFELKDLVPQQISSINVEDLKERLKNISKLERRILKKISSLEIQEKDIKSELVEIKTRLTKLEKKE